MLLILILNELYFFYSCLNKLTFYILIQFNCIYWIWSEVAPSQSSERVKQSFFICSHGGPEFLKNAGSFPTLWTAAICPACKIQRRAICPQGCLKKNKSIPGKHHGRGEGQGAGGGWRKQCPLRHWSQTSQPGSEGSAGDDIKVSSCICAVSTEHQQLHITQQ